MKKMESLSMRTILMIISTIILNAISIITAPIFTRIMTTADYGTYSLYLSWVSIFSIIFGIQTYGTLNNAKVDFDNKEYLNYCTNIFLLSFIGNVVGGGVFIACYQYVEGIIGLPHDVLPSLIVSSCGVYMVSFVSKYLLIEKKAIQNLLISVIVALVLSVGSIFLILHCAVRGYFARALVHSGTYLVAGLLIIFYFLSRTRVKIHISYWKYCLQLSLPLVIHNLSGVLLEQSDRIMLKSVAGESVVGIYSFCYTLAMPIVILINAMNSAWTPEYYLLMSADKKTEINQHYKRQMFLTTSICCGYILVVPEALKILATEEYWEGRPIISLVVISYFFRFLYLFPVNYEFYHKKTKYIAASTFVATLINICLNYILIPKYGMYGAAVATIVAYVFLFLIHEFMARKVIKNFEFEKSLYLKGLLIISGCSMLAEGLSEFVIIRWFLGMIIAIILIMRVKREKVLV